MKFKCPYCRRECDFQDVQADSDMAAVFQMIPGFGRHFTHVWAYIQLFSTTPLRMKSKKLRILVSEMQRLFEEERFAYQKKQYRISNDGVVNALDIMVHRHFEAALTNHNYLKKIMVSVAEEEARKTGAQAERDLRRKEERLALGERDDEAAEKNLKQVRAAIEAIK